MLVAHLCRSTWCAMLEHRGIHFQPWLVLDKAVFFCFLTCARQRRGCWWVIERDLLNSFEGQQRRQRVKTAQHIVAHRKETEGGGDGRAGFPSAGCGPSERDGQRRKVIYTLHKSLGEQTTIYMPLRNLAFVWNGQAGRAPVDSGRKLTLDLAEGAHSQSLDQAVVAQHQVCRLLLHEPRAHAHRACHPRVPSAPPGPTGGAHIIQQPLQPAPISLSAMLHPCAARMVAPPRSSLAVWIWSRLKTPRSERKSSLPLCHDP